MIKNKQSVRSFTAFLVTWSFIVLTVTGIVLYVVPQGRIAYWIHWSLGGLEKEQWGWVHMMFGGVFIITGVLHLYFNWKPFKKYLAGRVKGHLAIKQELITSVGLTLLLIVLSVYNLPPASWIIRLNEMVKSAWVSSPEWEPPFGHAEEVSLAGIARRMDLALQPALSELRAQGMQFESDRDSLDKVARLNDTTPMAVYRIMRRFAKPAPPSGKPITADDIEATYAGTGLGRKNLAEICSKVGLDIDVALRRLNAANFPATAEDNARELADRHDVSPIDLLTIMMLPE